MEATHTHTPDIFDVVELTVDCGRWAAGTRGAVVEVLDGALLVEVADDHGHTESILTVPPTAVAVVARSRAVA